MVEGRGVAEKQGVSLPRGIGHIPRIPLPHFWTGVGEKGAGGFACPQRENYKRLSTDFIKYAMRGCIPSTGTVLMAFAAGSRPVSAFVIGDSSEEAELTDAGTGLTVSCRGYSPC